jgi:hypothetical protein
MAFGLFRKRPPEPAGSAVADAPLASDPDSAKETLELPVIEFIHPGGMQRCRLRIP